jgi:hypothetical protein
MARYLSERDVPGAVQQVSVSGLVAHVQAVRFDHTKAQFAPGEKRCFRFYPRATAEYTLIASGVNGMTDCQKFTVTVK